MNWRKLWPFEKKNSKTQTTDERIAMLKPGDFWIYTEGVAWIVIYVGAKCAICGEEFKYVSSYPPYIEKALGPYHKTTFGIYKPSEIWYCLKHTNKEIERKIKQLDI